MTKAALTRLQRRVREQVKDLCQRGQLLLCSGDVERATELLERARLLQLVFLEEPAAP